MEYGFYQDSSGVLYRIIQLKVKTGLAIPFSHALPQHQLLKSNLKNHLIGLFQEHLRYLGFVNESLNCFRRNGVNQDICILSYQNDTLGISKYIVEYKIQLLADNKCIITLYDIQSANPNSQCCND
jgi:hypothetical protein